MQKVLIAGLLLVVVVMAIGFSSEFQQDKKIKPVKKMTNKEKDYQKEVAAIFKMHCAVSGCHKGRYPKKKLSLEKDKFVEATVDVNSLQVDSLKLVDSKQPEKSYLLMKVKGTEGIVDSKMPVDAPPLIDEEIKIIEQWIQIVKADTTDEKAFEKAKVGKKTIKN